MNVNKTTNKEINLFFYNHEYTILNIAGIICGLIILWIANNFFVDSKIYYLIFIFGLLVGGFGFVIEYYIKNEKRKSLETEFSYFLYDLSKEYKKTNNLSLALTNISEYNFYGDINTDIKRLANRVSWGDSFEDALESINKNINSSVIIHTLVLLRALKKSSVSYDIILKNISKDLKIFKSEDRSKKYFSNLFYLSLVFYFVFIFVLLYIDHIIGGNFLWSSNAEVVTRIFFDNFMLYLALLLGVFTAYVMYSIKKDKGINFVKYILLMFIITVILFQIFAPKPEAERILIDTIEYMIKNNETKVEIDNAIALKTISSKYISEKVETETIYFQQVDNLSCFSEECKEFTIFVNEPAFYDFIIEKQENNHFIIYYKKV